MDVLKKALLNPDDKYYARYKRHLSKLNEGKAESFEIKTVMGFENKGFENVVEELSSKTNKNIVTTDRSIVF